ncbi:hypothetical protein Avbf_13259, partial [Armadillidium vulgare]
MDIEFETASTNSVTHLADLLKEPSGCFKNFCRLSPHDFELTKNISPYSKENTECFEPSQIHFRGSLVCIRPEREIRVASNNII